MNGPTMGYQQVGTAQQPSLLIGRSDISGSRIPTKVVVNEDEMTVNGVRFVERKELTNDGIQSFITHSRTIGDATYEVVAVVRDGNLVDLNIHTNLEEEDIYFMQQMWTQAWLSDEQEQPLGSAGFPSYGGSRMATQGSQMAFDGGI